METAHAGEVGPLEAVHAVVVYDEATGDIVHVHSTLIFEGAAAPSVDEMTDAGLREARAAGLDVSRLAAMSAGNRLLDPNRRYRVDPESRELGEIEGAMRSAFDRGRA